MAAKNYKARIKLSTGAVQEVMVQAESPWNARAMLEAQYGKAFVISFPCEVL